MNSLNRKLLISPIALGYLAFLVLLTFSILFYLERTCYADIAFQSFIIINTKTVFPQLDRFGSFLVQLLPLSMVLMHFPLKYVLLSYSVALVLQNLLFYWLLHKVLKQREVALILVLYNVLMVTETFYWATNEVKQGFSFCIFYSGLILGVPLEKYSAAKKLGLLLLFAGLLVTTVFLHPLVLFAVVFVLGYGLFFRQASRQTLLWTALIVVLSLIVKYLLLPLSWYDKEQTDLRQNFITFFPNYFTLPSFRHFLEYCRKDWYLYGLMLVSVVIMYVRKKEVYKLGWLLLYSFGYLLLVNVTHPGGNNKVFTECYYMALGVFVLYPFVFELLPGLKHSSALIVLSVIFFLRLNTIFHAHASYTARLQMIRHTLASNNGKFIVPENFYPSHELKMSWGTPYETALLTSIVSPDSCRSFVILKDTADFKYAEMNNGYTRHLYSTFGGVSYTELNPVYFRPVPGRYRVLTRDEFMRE